MNDRFRPLINTVGIIVLGCLALTLLFFACSVAFALLGFGALAGITTIAMRITGLLTVLSIFPFIIVVIIALSAGRSTK